MSASDTVLTPDCVIDFVTGFFGEIDLDPCAGPEPFNVPAKAYFTEADDGLYQPWCGKVFCNPPYSNLEPWLEKGGLSCGEVVMLTPWRSYAAYWSDATYWYDRAAFLTGRASTFKGFKARLREPLALLYSGNRPEEFSSFARCSNIVTQVVQLPSGA